MSPFQGVGWHSWGENTTYNTWNMDRQRDMETHTQRHGIWTDTKIHGQTHRHGIWRNTDTQRHVTWTDTNTMTWNMGRQTWNRKAKAVTVECQVLASLLWHHSRLACVKGWHLMPIIVIQVKHYTSSKHMRHRTDMHWLWRGTYFRNHWSTCGRHVLGRQLQ